MKRGRGRNGRRTFLVLAVVALPVLKAYSQPANAVPADSWAETAYIAMNKGNTAEAISLFKDALKADPKSRNAWFGLATVHIQIRDYATAEKILLKLAQAYPEDYAIRNNIAWMYATAENPKFRNAEKAVKWARDAVFLSPLSPEPWSTLSEAHYLAGDYEKAFRAVEHVMDIAPREKLSREQARIYAEQYTKCKKAKEAMSLIP